jgi:hypothetical protein
MSSMSAIILSPFYDNSKRRQERIFLPSGLEKVCAESGTIHQLSFGLQVNLLLLTGRIGVDQSQACELLQTQRYGRGNSTTLFGHR